jgi:FkbM family methyltransferase
MKIVNGWTVPSFDNIISKGCKEFPNSDYQQTILDWAISQIENFNLAIDVGANIGLHTLRFSKLFNQVESFEPFSINYECLQENIKSFSNINIHKKGLGSTSTSLTLMLPEDSGNSGAPSFVDFVNTDKKTLTEQVIVARLDDFNFQPDLIKIDTQGFEMEILKGAVNTLQTYKPVLIVECAKQPFKDIANFLSTMGYVVGGTTNKDKGFYVPREN